MAMIRSLVVLMLGVACVRAGDLPPSYDDATLHAVQFVDATEGWAVGEHGLIWHTIDGGQTWERQKSGSRATLKSVQFLTPYTGYIFGRNELTGSLGSAGVILSTTDGGLTWNEVAAGVLPGLNVGRFFDGNNALVAGDSTPGFPTGIFTTTDGGSTWKPLDGPKGQRWQAVDFRDSTSGLLVSRSALATIENGRPKLLAMPDMTVTAGKFIGETILATGIDSIGKNRFAMSRDGGKTWPAADTALSIRCLTTNGQTVIAVGQPGNLMIRSGDGGATWANVTGPLPCSLNAVQMFNDKLGWAVGDLGSILQTTDGGVTWNVQKSGGQRLGVLFIHSKADSVPYDVIAKLGAKDGHLCGVVQVDHRGDCDRLAMTVRACGGAVTMAVPSNESLASIIAQYRPETIVTDAGELSKVVVAACAKSKHPVNAVFAITNTTAGATVQWDHGQVVPELAADVRDYCDTAVSLLGPSAKVPPYRLFVRVPTATDGPVDANGIIAEAKLARGGTARRKALPPQFPKEYLAQIEAMTKSRRTIDMIVADPEKAGGAEKALVALRDSLVGLPEDVAARTASHAAMEFTRKGQWGYAREVNNFIVESFPTFNEAAEAGRWLVRFHTSAEVKRRIELGHVKPLPMTIFDTVSDDALKPVGHTEGKSDALKPVYRFKTGPAMRKWCQMALDLEPKLVSFGPSLTRDPATYRGLLIARDRLGMNVPKLVEPTKSLAVPRTTAKPTLDGKGDDACWQGTSLTMGIGKMETTVKMAYDDQFLYVLVKANDRGFANDAPRERDADLTGCDRIELSLDLTHGGDTPFRFAIDNRGRLAEDCWGDRNWNPKWFVAFQPSEASWTAEVAIPLAELTGSPIAGVAWGVGVKRISATGDVVSLVSTDERCDVVFVK